MSGNVILKKASNLLIKAGRSLERESSKKYQSPQRKEVAIWFKDQGDKTFRLNYELDVTSLVFDLGGYEGQWTSDIFSMYCCTIHVFEPVKEFARKIDKRFTRNERIFVHEFGLSSANKKVQISINKERSSLYKQSDNAGDAYLAKAIDFIRENNIEKIDLMKINIEGGEYDLLEHLIECGFIKNIKNVQVQFHDFVPNAESRMRMIQQELARTHFVTYQYLFVWENWRVK